MGGALTGSRDGSHDASQVRTGPCHQLGEHALTYGHLVDGTLRAGAGTTLREVPNGVVRPALGRRITHWAG